MEDIQVGNYVRFKHKRQLFRYPKQNPNIVKVVSIEEFSDNKKLYRVFYYYNGIPLSYFVEGKYISKATKDEAMVEAL